MSTEKGLVSIASQEAAVALVINLVKDEKPPIKIGAPLLLKIVFLVADDKYADKLPEELKVKTRACIDAFLVAKDVELGVMLAIELIPVLYELFKKPDVEA